MTLDLSSRVNSTAKNSALYFMLIIFDDKTNADFMAMRTPPPFLLYFFGSSGSIGGEVVDLSV